MILFKKLRADAIEPVRATTHAAGFDMCAPERVEIAPGKTYWVPSGIAMAIPAGWVGLIWPRSGLAYKHGIDTLGGVIDADYRGEVKIGLIHLGSEPVEIKAGEAVFRASSTAVVEAGFQKVLHVLAPKKAQKRLPKLEVGESVEALRFHPEQHFTSGPARYTDATIVKILEEKGIGRPSTYAPIISVLLDRYYVVRKNRQLVATQLGRIINDLLTANFSELVNENFTADMERRLDEIERGNGSWEKILEEFYRDFKPQVEHVMETLESIKGILDEPTDMVCEKCGRPMVKKLGRFGFFIACTGFPECRNTKSVPLADCPRPDCDGKIVARRAQKGRRREFYGCTNYPECDFVTYDKPTGSNCPRCGRFLVEKRDKQRGAYKACINPDCDYLHTHEAEDKSA